ncbi:TetR/AcrR family transcriptional regulator [Pseudoclavibacter sp. CFCC 13796]|uniref:TetR/AcrR family transcriptional regulator n=1 Tax=Pseudoclavibacter sp. CFCC 13796 TaxID=2615179 RepID=UPI0013012559|nr:TetR/AcrR family transcriptional regulator [Pseudoclavibacter sp. CFCC 13796]KAB1661695.1 TetR/AcrR family transcriptional regulator [Pseudoclavibacter sp. CFCC 13796]
MESESAKPGYHHGDLRAALVLSALEILESGEAFSLRAVARRAGVSTAAPYRHFPDRKALESAMAVHGLHELMGDLAKGAPLPRSTAEVAELAVGYVRFALRRPALFRLMFGQPCDDQDDERVQAAGTLHDYLEAVMATVFPQSDPVTLAAAGWSLAHGLAFLHLDGKLNAVDQGVVDERVRSIFTTVFPPITSSRIENPS